MADTAVVEWADFIARWRWKQGEHVSCIGPTGRGKTTLIEAIVPRRQFVVAFGTKPKDSSLDRFIRYGGFRKTREWPPPAPTSVHGRWVLWPKCDELGSEPHQQETFMTCMRDVYARGSWTVVLDEVAYLTDGPLRMAAPVSQLWRNGRSIGITVVGATQRPSHVPLLLYSSATHLFFWQTGDETDLKRIGGLNGVNSREVRDTVARLPRHAVLYVNAVTGERVITRVDRSTERSA